MTEQILYKTLDAIGTNMEYRIAPDTQYLKALEKIGFIKLGFKNELTDFGRSELKRLQNKFIRHDSIGK
jgi:hypothetical protein